MEKVKKNAKKNNSRNQIRETKQKGNISKKRSSDLRIKVVKIKLVRAPTTSPYIVPCFQIYLRAGQLLVFERSGSTRDLKITFCLKIGKHKKLAVFGTFQYSVWQQFVLLSRTQVQPKRKKQKIKTRKKRFKCFQELINLLPSIPTDFEGLLHCY